LRSSDRFIGIVIGILIGLAIVIAFVFLGSGDTIDDPSLSGDEPAQEQTQPAQPQQPESTQP
jgi:hypothetical protein